MKPVPRLAGLIAQEAGNEQCATQVEVEGALHALGADDHAKLMLIAVSFCRRRGLSASVLEPKELLHEAMLKTLQMDKKWNKEVSFVKHLDRAMENISGHLVRERSKIIPFPDGLTAPPRQAGDKLDQTPADNVLEAREEAQALLRSVFGDDQQAMRVFCKRVEGYGLDATMTDLGLDARQMETIARRIRRCIARFLKGNNQN